MRYERLFVTVACLSLLPISVFGAPNAPASTNLPAVCVSEFYVDSTDESLKGIAFALSDLLVVQLSRQKEVRVVEREHLAALLREQTVSLSGLSDPATAARVGKLLGAAKFVTGSVILMKDEMTVVAQLLDVSTGRVQASQRVNGKASDLTQLTVSLAEQIANALNLKIDAGSGGMVEERPDASAHFLRGLGFFHAGNLDRAITEFMSCRDIDPLHSSSLYWIGLCYFRQNRFAHAKIELNRFLKDAPTSDKAGDAKRMSAECEARMKEEGAPKTSNTNKVEAAGR